MSLALTRWFLPVSTIDKSLCSNVTNIDVRLKTKNPHSIGASRNIVARINSVAHSLVVFILILDSKPLVNAKRLKESYNRDLAVDSFTAAAQPDASMEKDNVYDVVIVGAGWAGLGAANYLKEADVTNFMVLEARDYIGGRSVTSYELGTDKPVELGSEWIHGTEVRKKGPRFMENPVFTAAKEYGAPYGISDFNRAFYKSNGEMILDSQAASLSEKYWSGSDEGFM